MLLFEKTYDLDELARRNMHLHSTFSGCAKPEMKLPDIVKEAEKSGLEAIAITDHSNLNDGRDVFSNNQILHKQLSELDTPVRVFIGSEVSAYGVGKYSESIKVNNSLEFKLYSQNHYHVEFWEQPEDKTPRGYAEDMLRSLRALFKTGRADCIAHPFIDGYIRCITNHGDVTAAITDTELGDILETGYRAGCAWEINVGACFGDPVFAHRMYQIGKEAGVAFSFGTDGHNLSRIDTKQFLVDVKRILY